MIRISTGLAAVLLLASLASAQDMEAKYKEKLAKEFASKISWMSSLEAAQKKSAEEDRLIFGYFSRSYAP